MRILLVAAVLIGLSACSDWNGNFFGEDESAPPAAASNATAAPDSESSAPMPPPSAAAESEPPVVSAARTAPGPTPAVAAHCKNLAKQRASDAAYQGEDPETQETVYGTTYRDCIAWDAAHRS